MPGGRDGSKRQRVAQLGKQVCRSKGTRRENDISISDCTPRGAADRPSPFCGLTNQQRREGSFHGWAREDDDGDDVADQAEEGDGRQEDARGHELEQLELQTEEKHCRRGKVPMAF